MITKHCAVCGSTVDIENHHIDPHFLGGSDDETNLLSVCYIHHGMLHDIKRPASFSSLHKARIKKQKERGEYHGGALEFGKKMLIKNGIKCLDWDKNSIKFKALVYIVKNKSTFTYRELSIKIKKLFNVKISFQQVYVLYVRNMKEIKCMNLIGQR